MRRLSLFAAVMLIVFIAACASGGKHVADMPAENTDYKARQELAEEKIKSLKEKPLSDEEKYITEGAKLAKKGQYGKAIENFTKAIEINPELYSYMSRGIAYWQNRQPDKAIPDLTEAMKLDPDDVRVYYFRGHAYTDNVEFDKAIKDLTKAIEMDPEDAGVYFARGRCYFFKGEYEKSIEDNERVVTLNPNVAVTYYNLACAYSKLKKEEKACESLQTAIEKGFDEFEHMKKDVDLDNIRENYCYKKIIEDLG